MFKNVILLICAILLISSLSLVMASEDQRLTSTSQKADVQDEIQKIQKVSEMRTVTVRGTLKIRPSRDVKAVKAVAREEDASKVKSGPAAQSKQSERIFQQPLQKRTNTLNHKNVKESTKTVN